MRVCHVIESGATGSLQMVLLMAETQRKMGFDVLIVYSRRAGTPADLRKQVNPAIDLVHLRMRPLAPHLVTWCWGFTRIMHRRNPDVLHLHGSRAGFLGRLMAGRRWGPRVYYSPHCIVLMHINMSQGELALYGALERLANWVCPGRYVACTEPERAVVVREITTRTFLVENAVEDGLDAFVDPGRALGGAVRRVVTCARIADLKDPPLFADVCRAVRAVRPEVEFVWIGDGDVGQRRVLERAGVVVTGWMSREDALRNVSASCVYLSTSRWEGMPVSVLEAMVMKVPVLCRRADWSAAIIRDGKTGRLFDGVSSAADALLSADAAWRLETAEGAWRVAKARFSEARFATELARVYADSAPATLS